MYTKYNLVDHLSLALNFLSIFLLFPGARGIRLTKVF